MTGAGLEPGVYAFVAREQLGLRGRGVASAQGFGSWVSEPKDPVLVVAAAMALWDGRFKPGLRELDLEVVLGSDSRAGAITKPSRERGGIKPGLRDEESRRRGPTPAPEHQGLRGRGPWTASIEK